MAISMSEFHSERGLPGDHFILVADTPIRCAGDYGTLQGAVRIGRDGHATGEFLFPTGLCFVSAEKVPRIQILDEMRVGSKTKGGVSGGLVHVEKERAQDETCRGRKNGGGFGTLVRTEKEHIHIHETHGGKGKNADSSRKNKRHEVTTRGVQQHGFDFTQTQNDRLLEDCFDHTQTHDKAQGRYGDVSSKKRETKSGRSQKLDAHSAQNGAQGGYGDDLNRGTRKAVSAGRFQQVSHDNTQIQNGWVQDKFDRTQTQDEFQHGSYDVPQTQNMDEYMMDNYDYDYYAPDDCDYMQEDTYDSSAATVHMHASEAAHMYASETVVHMRASETAHMHSNHGQIMQSDNGQIIQSDDGSCQYGQTYSDKQLCGTANPGEGCSHSSGRIIVREINSEIDTSDSTDRRTIVTESNHQIETRNSDDRRIIVGDSGCQTDARNRDDKRAIVSDGNRGFIMGESHAHSDPMDDKDSN